jgi:hypothetical protein
MIKICQCLAPLLLLGTLACGVPARDPRPEGNKGCDEIRIQDSSWTGSNVRASLACLVQDERLHAQILALDPSRFDTLAQALEDAFRDPAQRALFLESVALVEAWPRGALARFLGEDGVGHFLADSALSESLPLLNLIVQRLLPLLEADPQILAREIPLFAGTLEDAGLDGPEVLVRLRRSLPLFAAPDAAGHARRIRAGRLLLKKIASDPSLQEAFGRLGDAPGCASARSTPTGTRSLLETALVTLKADARQPRRLVNSLAQGYLVWEAVCQPDAGLRPEDASKLLGFVSSDFAFVNELESQLPSASAPAPALEVLRASGVAGTPERNLVASLQTSRLARTLLALLEDRAFYAQVLERLPSEDTLRSLAARARDSGLSARPFASIPDWRALARLLQGFEHQPKLVRGLSELLDGLDAERALERLSLAAADGSLSEGLRLLSRIGPDSGNPAVTQLPFASEGIPSDGLIENVPALSNSVESERRRAAQLAERCMGRSVDEGSWSCLEREGYATGPADKSPYRRIPADSKLFPLLAKLPLAPWVEAGTERFWRDWARAARSLKLPVEAALRWIATGTALSERSRTHVMRALHEALDDERANHPGAQRRDPIGPRFFLDRMSTRLFEDGVLVPPAQRAPLAKTLALLVERRNATRLIRSLRTLARKHHEIQLTHQEMREGALYKLNGIEAYDRLLWEMQVPLVRDPDRIMSIVNSWIRLSRAEDASAWMTDQRRDVDMKLRLAQLIADNDSPMIHGLKNVKRLLQLIHETHTSEEIYQFGRLLAEFASGPQYTRVEMETVLRLHQLGLVGALGHLFEYPPRDIGNTLEGDTRPLAELIGRIGVHQAWELARLNHFSQGRLLRGVAVLGVSSLSDPRMPHNRSHWDWFTKGWDDVLAPWLREVPALGNATLAGLDFPEAPASLGSLIVPELPQAASNFLDIYEDFGGRRWRLLESDGLERLIGWIGGGVPRRLLDWLQLLEPQQRQSPET